MSCHLHEMRGSLNEVQWKQTKLHTVILELLAIAFTNAKASGVEERMLSTRPSLKRRIDALS